MNCILCNTQCIIPNTKSTSNSQNIAIIESNGDLYCIGCKDAKDFASGITSNDSDISKKNNVKPLAQEIKTNIKKEVFYKCIKCSHSFTGSSCECGFKNPLYRR